ncbi:hypothetical protein ASPWEDRAFT_26915 [Aspergillus wentii DTO 134E9]|uniref:Mid2 domain-containing protein n=1 Tax=Aspergillus wentii DTO 134E9 TaxID=1073089 RepID=A0A1L9RRK7_ASPWE|nr:uncharacterized protein ASPWEDRAFT_26915 [Aspergillus wentii DTO 134E9]KAI9930384.1 hypothetical protein MW887_011137 [Aspergillus wentii]OJJ37542.1 hypothetical protein ASPWEDRAFT_26915 [Aspergillus wentii DTO 134E9]
MKTSNILVCLVPAMALAVDPQHTPSAVASSSVSPPSITPPYLSPESRTPAVEDGQPQESLAVRQVQVADQEQPADANANIGLTKSTTTKALRVRSEGTLGQTPWIGMAIGLTCTALAAVMLG